MFCAEQFGTTLDACGGCGGVWVDNKLGAQIARIGNSVAQSVAGIVDARAQQRVDLAAAIVCPECAQPLARTVVPGNMRRPLEIDCCNTHGTWFDRGELASLLIAVEQRRQAGDMLDANLAHTMAQADAQRGADNRQLAYVAFRGVALLAKVATGS
jgi:Zn-finger nucleic acid-binding protein